MTAATPTVLAATARHSVGRAIVCADTPEKAARAVQRQRTDMVARTSTSIELSSMGVMTGRTLRVDRADRSRLSISLPIESFVGDRSGDAIVYTRVGGGRGSEVHLVDLASGCDVIVARPRQIVRSAIVDPTGTAVFVHSVSRSGRRDAGVERHDLATAAVTTALPALAANPLLGPIHATELRWSLNGDSLAVQSCGFAACLTRVLDVVTGEATAVDEPGQGALIGLTEDKLVTFASCPGRPCPVLVHDTNSGTSSTLAGEAYEATVSIQGNGAVVSIVTADGKLEVPL